MYNISIIIPHKNTPQLLERCIASIPERNDIQIIVVDDHSTPPLQTLKQFSDQRNIEIHQLDKQHQGAGAARNEGLHHIKGRLLIFSDSDDFFHPSIFQLCDKYLNTDIDIIFFDTNSVMSDTMQPINKRDTTIDLYKKSHDENILRYQHHTVWGKIFRTSLISNFNIKFQEVSASNDAYFAVQAGFFAKKIIFEPVIAYCSTVRKGSICTEISKKNIDSRIFVGKSINKLLSQKNIHVKYWTNILGPIFNMKKISYLCFGTEIFKYFASTPLNRIYLDFKESGKRLIKRHQGQVNDKDIKSLQTIRKQ